MNNYQSYNEEGTFKDLLTLFTDPLFMTIKDVRDAAHRILGSDEQNAGFNISRNIAKSAKALTATFPVIVTEATPLDQAVMISKSVERKAIAMLQMLFAANQITNINNAMGYLRKFHHNLDSSLDWSGADVDDVIDYCNNIQEDVDINLEHDYVHQGAIQEAVNTVYKDIAMQVNDARRVPDISATMAIHEYTCYGPLNEVQIGTKEKTKEKDQSRNVGNVIVGDIWDIDRKETETSYEEPGTEELKHAYDIINKGIIKTDVAKSNESVPSLMIVNFVSLIDSHKVINTAVIGVKAVLHYVPSEEMVNRVIMKNSDKNGLFNLIRATTGEIKFFKDFLFAVDRAKVDAIGRSGKGSNSKIWKLLELRADKSKYNRSRGANNTDCAAIATLIINKTEVDLIKKYHRIDLMKPGTLIGIMRGYSLMCAAIVDETLERVDFMYDDGDSKFETLSFMSLEREESGGQLKKVINVLASKGR